MRLEPKNADVFQGARRRYFSRAAAERSYFWAALKRHCECEEPDMSTPYSGGGYTCDYHRDDFRDLQAKLMARFLRLHFSSRA